jgi:hypothetical protein
VSAYDKDRDGREGYFSLEHCSVFNERPIDLVHVQTMLLQYSAEHRAVWPKQGGEEEGEGGRGGVGIHQEITRQAQPRNQTTVSEYLSVDLEKGLSDLIYIVI